MQFDHPSHLPHSSYPTLDKFQNGYSGQPGIPAPQPFVHDTGIVHGAQQLDVESDASKLHAESLQIGGNRSFPQLANSNISTNPEKELDTNEQQDIQFGNIRHGNESGGPSVPLVVCRGELSSVI